MSQNNGKHRRSLRQAEARERQRVRDDTTSEQQLRRLDTLLGKGKGAKKERAKLTALLPENKKTEKKGAKKVTEKVAKR